MSPRWEPNPSIRRGCTVICTLHAHLVFAPEYRRGPFTEEILRRCEEGTRRLRRLRNRTGRVQRRTRPRPPPCALPAEGIHLQAGGLPQRRLRPQPPPGGT